MKVGNTSACEVSNSASQDFLNSNPLTVNAEEFFDIDTWAFIKKDDDLDAKSGTWSLSASVWNLYDSVMLIFKSGNQNSGQFLIGYLADDGALSGAWDSPFVGFNPKGKEQIKDVSHVSYYGVNNTTPVPLPAAGWLLIGAMGALGVAARRRRKSS
jgi:hypothetical protein